MVPSKKERIGRVEKFNESCREAGFIELNSNVFELRGTTDKTLTLCTLVHGNEIGGIEVFSRLLNEIKSGKLKPQSSLRLILGNVDAYYEDKRFLESDMNRSFGHPAPVTKEEKRALELEQYLKDTDILVDIHQTIGSTRTPFFIFEYDQRSYNFARYLNGNLPVVMNTKKRDFKGKTSTGLAISNGALAVTIETGQKGIEDTQISLGLEIARKVIETNFENMLPECAFSNTFTFLQIIRNPDRTLEMVKEYRNFDPVKKDELLAKNTQHEVRSEVDGVILFPKYGDFAKASVELALILKPVKTVNDFP